MIAQRVEALIQTIIKEDILAIKAFKPSHTTPFRVRKCFWLILDQFAFNEETARVLISNAQSISFKGIFLSSSDPLSPVNLYNDALKTVVAKCHMSSGPRLADVKPDWKFSLRLLLYNQADWQFSAETYLKKTAGRHTLQEVMTELADNKKEKFFQHVFSLIQKIQEYLCTGSLLIDTCNMTLEVVAIMGGLCYDKSSGKMLGNSSFWLRVHLFVYGVLKNCMFWQNKNLDVSRLFKKCISILREYVSFHVEACSDQKESRLFYLDWAKETILTIKPWLAVPENATNFMSCELIIDIFNAVVDQCRITLTEDWKSGLQLDINLIKNNSQRLKIGDFLSSLPTKRAAVASAEDVSFYKYQKVHIISDDDDDAPVIIEQGRSLRTTAAYEPNRYYAVSNTSAPEIKTSTTDYSNYHDIIHISKYPSAPIPSNLKASSTSIGNHSVSKGLLIQPAPVRPKIPLKVALPSSKAYSKTMQKLQQEHATERIRVSIPSTTISEQKQQQPDKRPHPRPDPKPVLAPSPTQDFIPRRPAKLIELSTVNKSGRGPTTFVPTVVSSSSKTAAQLISVKKLYLKVLAWEVSKASRISEQQYNKPLSKVPNSFKDAESYVGVFEPLYIEELRTRFIQGLEEAESRNSRIMLLESIRNVDSIHGKCFAEYQHL